MAAQLRSIDPRARLAAAALLSVCVAVAQSFPACLLGLAVGILLLAAARPEPGQLWRRGAAVNIFLLFLWCVTPWTTPGRAVWSAGPLSVTGEGLWLSLLVSLKANAICAIFTALTTGMDIATLGHAMRRLGCPQGLAWLVLFMGRYIHVIRNEWRSLMTAARLRCFVPKSNAHTWRTLATLLGLLLVRSHDRARRVHEAMLLRGFTGSFRPLDTFAWRGRDTAFTVALLFCAALLLWTELYGAPHA
ncbi:cobalt ECF transporter T component CbiQ [Desulfovibrio sp.]|uniref:cobalt ECF transporter T component CbiQ n=1 Tax=Desulfovibrio sp. TaxID=885 RepID=UPI0023C68972|nr:cobalt ECF transporter T component CbiQ [Desulfovibrio sp.]MDE7241181.1 cobalt ECF transporter T component CbiQ [Desulfovibrio sp.]